MENALRLFFGGVMLAFIIWAVSYFVITPGSTSLSSDSTFYVILWSVGCVVTSFGALVFLCSLCYCLVSFLKWILTSNSNYSILTNMEHYLIQIDGQLLVASGTDWNDARNKVLAAHPNSRYIRIVGDVEEILQKLKPFIVISEHVSL